MIYGLVDLGSNSIRMSIYRVEEGRIKLLMNKKETAGLSAYVENGAMRQAGINKACQILNDFLGILDNFAIANIYVFATASLRNITNTAEAVAFIRRATGLTVDVLSGEEEAKMGFIGAVRSAGIQDGVLIDIGGGSTELTQFQKGLITASASMPIGSLNLYIRHVGGVLPSDRQCRDIRYDVLSQLGDLTFSGPSGGHTIYGIGGTVRATTKLVNEIFDLPPDNREISYANLSQVLLIYKEAKQRMLKYILQTSPERIHTLVPGMIILKTVARHFDGDIILENNFGIREGYLYDRVLGGMGHADARTEN